MYEKDVLDMIRRRTEEEENQQSLKKTLGGYTKQSVDDYLNLLRRREQIITETFNKNLQTVLEEKENLAAEKEQLKTRLQKIESDYQWLTENLKINELESNESSVGEVSVDDILSLKSNMTALEAENKKLKVVINDLEQRVEHFKNEEQQKENTVTRVSQEVKIHKEMLAEEKNETKRQLELVSELTVTIENLQNEIKFLKELVEEEKINELNDQITKLTADMVLLDNIVAIKNQEIGYKERDIGTLRDETAALKQSVESVTKTLDDVMLQNEKMVYINGELMKALDEEREKTLQLLKEKSEQTVEKLRLNRALEKNKLDQQMKELGNKTT